MANTKLTNTITRADGEEFVRTTIDLPKKLVPYVLRGSNRRIEGTAKRFGVTGFLVYLIGKCRTLKF